VNGRLLTFVRHPQKFVKVGSDAAAVVWVGPSSVVLMQSEFIAGEYRMVVAAWRCTRIRASRST